MQQLGTKMHFGMKYPLVIILESMTALPKCKIHTMLAVYSKELNT